MKSICLCVVFLLVTGCSTVKPYERGRLSKLEMQIEPDRMMAAFHRHVYFSKEASSGGNSGTGGGCGCN
ncbi:DUF4266 domain-containing protein [Pleionea sediminis]|uniref:DUF4266 domain-containing protein n=1 Tax=Pleionea sediminis TaxID=2569479 RepID=UPI001186A040|nr:DUF4266 domain-containing protein [Pleionea sediminis]